MYKEFEYTTIANRFTGKFPFLAYVGIQVNFWVLANLLLVTIFNFYNKIVGQAYGIPIGDQISNMVWIAILLGGIYGVCLGILGYMLEKTFFSKLSLGKIILVKAVSALSLLILLLWLLRFVFFESWIRPSLYTTGNELNENSWKYLFYLLLTYYFFMTLVVSFINQVNNKYGPGVLLPLLLGRYRVPKEEERTFMFMDLKSSTTTAEQLGHLKYSSFIRDCFTDINNVLFPYGAQVYQYVGDEIVVTWAEKEGLKNHQCIQFYFACKKRFFDKKEYYLTRYGHLPAFKAGLHTGKITAVEIGEIKKDIAYHGDTINIASRIQGLCNEYNTDFLVSEYFLAKAGPHPFLEAESLGMIQLRGKTKSLGITSVKWLEEHKP